MLTWSFATMATTPQLPPPPCTILYESTSTVTSRSASALGRPPRETGPDEQVRHGLRGFAQSVASNPKPSLILQAQLSE